LNNKPTKFNLCSDNKFTDRRGNEHNITNENSSTLIDKYLIYETILNILNQNNAGSGR